MYLKRKTTTTTGGCLKYGSKCHNCSLNARMQAKNTKRFFSKEMKVRKKRITKVEVLEKRNRRKGCMGKN